MATDATSHGFVAGERDASVGANHSEVRSATPNSPSTNGDTSPIEKRAAIGHAATMGTPSGHTSLPTGSLRTSERLRADAAGPGHPSQEWPGAPFA